MTKFILRGREPVPADLMTWAAWFENPENRRVANDKNETTEVSTMFIGAGPECLFETCIFHHDQPVTAFGMKVSESEVVERYDTWDEAVAGHTRHCAERGLG